MTRLQLALSDWDGKDTAIIKAIGEQLADQPVLTNELIALLANDEAQMGASWLIRRRLERHGDLDDEQSDALLHQLKQLSGWQSRLHLLQCLAHVHIAESNIGRLQWFLAECMQHGNRFLRAWSYHGYYCLASQHPRFRDEVLQMLQMGLDDESASVTARIRHCLRTGFPDD